MPAPLAAVSVDLDEVGCYCAIHGLEPPGPDAAHAIYQRALPRFAQLFADEGIDATLFVIGADAEHPRNAEQLRGMHLAGHELANHSHHHYYDLTRRDRSVMRSEVDGCAQLLKDITGQRPRGFRAPGYTVSDTLFDVLAELDVGYDSSVFPCPAYYAAKTTSIAGIALSGKRSRSVVDDPRVLSAPANPYRAGRPYYRPGNGIAELPIGVTRDATLRLPYIGTSVVLSPPRGARWLSRAMAGRPLINLELHGIDLADAELDGLTFLRPYQPDLRRSLAAKLESLRAALDELRSMGARFVTLEQAAGELVRPGW